jgi:hypothetical protein
MKNAQCSMLNENHRQNVQCSMKTQGTNNMKPDIDCLKNLHSGQLQQLRFFVENLGYRKAAERASEEFNQSIHKSAIQRFVRRAAPAEFIEDTPENDEVTRQILKFAADGQPDFTAGTVRALEQLAFQLAFTCTAIDDDMNALTKISAMLCRFRNAATRERMAAVQEGKLKLRQQQFEKSNNTDLDAHLQEMNDAISTAFGQHPLVSAIRKAESMGGADVSSAPAGVSSAPAGVSPAEKAPTTNKTAPVPPENKKQPKRSSANAPHRARQRVIPMRQIHPSSVKSAPSDVVFAENPSGKEPSTINPYEIRNPQSEIRNT